MASLPQASRVTRVALLVAVGVVGLAGCSGGPSTVTTESVPPTIDIAENPDGGTFRLLTYNVAGLPVEISTVRPDVNLPLISPLLNDDEVVMTQEDYDWWKPDGLASTVDFVNYHGRLRAQATHEYQSPQHPGADALGITDRPQLELGDGLGILSRLPAEGDVRVPWERCFGAMDQNDNGKADCLAMKGFQMTTLTLPSGGEVDAYNLNAEAGTAAEDQRLQAADFEQLAQYIAAHSKGRAVIVAGNTNLYLDDAHRASGDGQDGRIWAAFLKAAGLTDACEASTCDDDVIDRVVYRSGTGVALEASSQRLRTDKFIDEDGKPLSDHPPVEVVFSWRPTKRP